jgi:hypothetical protein
MILAKPPKPAKTDRSLTDERLDPNCPEGHFFGAQSPKKPSSRYAVRGENFGLVVPASSFDSIARRHPDL